MNTLPTNADIASAKFPATYEQAKVALASCSRIDECKDWANKSEALASYAKMADDDSLRQMADRIQARAVRRMGDLLKSFDALGKRTDQLREGALHKLTQKEAAASAGISEHQRKQAVRLASIPLDDFEAQVESDSPPTVTQLAQQGVQRRVSKPVIDLQARDPGEFNRSLHFIAVIDDYANAIAMADLDEILPALTASETEAVRKLIAEIDLIHSRVLTRRCSSQGGVDA